MASGSSIFTSERQRQRSSSITWRRNNQAEAVEVAKPKDARAPGVSRLRIERGARALRVGCQSVDILRGGDLERESFPLHAINSPGPILLGQEDANCSRPQADGEQPATAFEFTVNREAEHVAIPLNAASNVGHCEGRLKALREQRWGSLVGRWIVRHIRGESVKARSECES